MKYFAKVKVVSESGETLADYKRGPFLSYQYASGIAQQEVMALWSELCLDEDGLSYQACVEFCTKEVK